MYLPFILLEENIYFFKLLLSPSFLTYLAMLDASFDFSLGGSNSQWAHQHYDQQNEMQSHLLKKTHTKISEENCTHHWHGQVYISELHRETVLVLGRV